MRLNRLATIFNEEFYAADPGLGSSVSTIARELHRLNLSRKVLQRRHIRACAQQQLEYLDSVAFVHPSKIIDIDGMVQCPKDFLARYGWAPVGEDAVKIQLTIGTRRFAVMAAYSELGFVAWEIFDGEVSQMEVTNFILYKVRPLLLEGSFAILDNASNQKTALVQDALELAFEGNYMYCSTYSPELKPVERGFSNIKCYIRDHEDEALRDPIQFIDHTFELYSVGGARGIHAYHHFDLYRENNRQFVEECALGAFC
mmetsp:Transcript_34895/g.76949  ORF Transcript_34895/g.76949 Transcript_34895/m.76949 type:complete len:257 (-) Transcript_34895:32-802(-)